jgi:hypothetical protein
MSSPGLRYSRLRYSLAESALQGVINVVPERDVVPLIDEQMGRSRVGASATWGGVWDILLFGKSAP